MPKQFNMGNLVELDNGKGNAAILFAIGQAVRDVNDRPGEKAKRKVTVTYEFTPGLDPDTLVLDVVNMQIKIKTGIPDRHTTIYPMLPGKDGTLLFEPASPFNPRQQTLDFPRTKPPETADAETVDEETGEVTNDEDNDSQEV